MSDLACGVHALDSVLNTECVHCLRIRVTAKDAEIERLKAELAACRSALLREGMERDEARNAARWLRDWVYESQWTHFTDEDMDYLKDYPWLEEESIEADPVRAMTGDEIRELIAENELMLENICDLETRCVAKAADYKLAQIENGVDHE